MSEHCEAPPACLSAESTSGLIWRTRLPEFRLSPGLSLVCWGQGGGGGGGWVGGLVANQKLSWTSLVVQWLRCLPTHAQVQSLVRELDPTYCK